MKITRRYHCHRRLGVVVAIGLLVSLLGGTTEAASNSTNAGFEIRLETVMEHDDGAFLWYHPRATPIPSKSAPMALITLQKHLRVSDYYSGLYMMKRAGLEGSWTGPAPIPELDWKQEADGTTISVADVTPGWHPQTRKIIALGCQVPYSKSGEQLDLQPRQHQTAYAVYDPERDAWSKWNILEAPAGQKFDLCRNACAQWLVKADGRLLVPVYFGPSTKAPFSATVFECSFDGERLRYERHQDELRLNVARGLYEPSLAAFSNRYFLTLRNDLKGYVAVSDDGLRWRGLQPWTFDDGEDLGSYNTQQHWLTHQNGLFLVYTRRGAGNDHIPRHRAPLFIAQVDPDTLRVLRRTERVLIPERGAELGNFGAAAMSPQESWVTVSEGLWSEEARRRGGKGATYIARILWSTPNELVR